jgi:hypothetical protein
LAKSGYRTLAPALRELGFAGMAARAELGVYSDFETELAFPKMTLVEDLHASGQFNNVDVEPLVRRVMDGEFDG